ncbi:MAG: glycosyltransferase family 4 protein [bacterium]|nr:glycosyltransferase family 4 protein [bacterium]
MSDHKRFNLWVINQFASTPAYSSGAGERFYYLAPFFDRADYNIKIFSGGYNHLFLAYPKTPLLFNREDIPGGQMIWIKMRHYSGESFVGRFLSWFEFLFKLFCFRFEKKDVPDIVLVSSMSIFPVFYALYLRIRFSTKVILEVRDIWPLTPIELGGYSKHNPFIRMMSWVEKYSYRKVDKLVSVLPGFSRHVETVISVEKDISWIPNACSPIFENIESHSTPLYKLDSQYFNILYTGAMGIANAMEYVIKAAQLLEENKTIRFILIGDGPEKETLQLQYSHLSNVAFLPKVSKNNLHSIISQADATIISWRNKKLYEYGVSANKYNDYMLASKPIISASNIKDDPVILSGAGIQAEAENPNSIAKAVQELFKMSPQARIDMGKKGKEFVLANQTYEVIAKKYIRIINEAVNHAN